MAALSDLKISGESLKKYHQPLVLAGLALAILIAWFLFLAPQYGKFRQIQTASNNSEEQLGNLDKEIEQVGNLSVTLDAVSPADRAKLEKMVPYGENLEELLTSMHKLGQQSNMLITSMFVQPSKTTDSSLMVDPLGEEVAPMGPQKMQLSVSMRGSYQNLIAFLEMVERHARLIDIDSISVSPAGRTEVGSSTLTVQINAFAYYLEPVPDMPLLPYGSGLDLSILEREQFKLLQTLSATATPQSLPSSNPFVTQ